jgi:hypothetical protein
MNLPEQESTLFFELVSALDLFVNRRMGIYPEIKTLDDYYDGSNSKKVDMRQALYQNIKLIDAFVKENPSNFSKEKRSIVSGWKHFVSGDFYLERFLKKQGIFIKDDAVYSVLGLSQPFDEVLPPSRLPLYVHASLLPFKGKIIYDGFFGIHHIYFGGGIKKDLKETYMRAKQNNRIIVSIEKGRKEYQKKSTAKPLKDWKPELDEIAVKVKKLRGNAGQPAIHTPAFSLAKAGVQFAQIAVSDPGDLDSLYAALKKVKRALSKATTVLDREE